MSTKKLALLLIVMGFVAVVAMTVRDQATNRAFDRQFGELLDDMGKLASDAQENPAAANQLYENVGNFRQRLQAVPTTQHHFREDLRGQLASLLDGLEKMNQDNPLDARSSTVIGQVFDTLINMRQALREGPTEGGHGH